MPTYTPVPILPLPAARRDQLAERLHRTLDGGTPRPDSKYQRRELALHIVSAYEAQQNRINVRNAQALQADFIARQKLEKEWYFDALRAQAEGGGTTDEFLVSFITPTHIDPVTDRDYCLVPQALLDLRQYQNLPGEGVYDVLPLDRKGRRENPFVPARGSQATMLAGLFKNGLDGKYLFSRLGERVNLDWEPGQVRPAKRWAQLELFVVIRERKGGELPDPALEQAAQDSDILALASKLALKVAVEDKVDDNNAVT